MVIGIAVVVIGLASVVFGGSSQEDTKGAFAAAESAAKVTTAMMVVLGGVGPFFSGLLLRLAASIARALLDNTAFNAPLTPAERTRLAFEAGDEQADPRWGTP